MGGEQKPWNFCHSEMHTLTSGKVERETELNEFTYRFAYTYTESSFQSKWLANQLIEFGMNKTVPLLFK